jgi:hypothetical protein
MDLFRTNPGFSGFVSLFTLLTYQTDTDTRL